MKYLSAIILLLISVGFLSCSSDDDSNNFQNLIVGNWRLVDIDISNQENLLISDCILMSRLTFNSDGTAVFENYSDNNQDCTLDISNFNYTIDENTLSFITGDTTTNFTYELSSTNFSYTFIEGNTTSTSFWLKVE